MLASEWATSIGLTKRAKSAWYIRRYIPPSETEHIFVPAIQLRPRGQVSALCIAIRFQSPGFKGPTNAWRHIYRYKTPKYATKASLTHVAAWQRTLSRLLLLRDETAVAVRAALSSVPRSTSSGSSLRGETAVVGTLGSHGSGAASLKGLGSRKDAIICVACEAVGNVKQWGERG